MRYGLLLPIVTVLAIASLLFPAPTASGRTVILESFSNTQCPRCHAVNMDLRTIYYEDGPDFVFVTLVENKVDLADERMDDYAPLEHSFPLVQVDGVYRAREGQEDIDVYREDISDALARDVPAVRASVEVHWRGQATVEVKAMARMAEGGPRDVRIIAYIVEAESRYRDHKGRRYAFGMLDIPIDAVVTLTSTSWWTNVTVWNGAEHNDSKGDHFGDVDLSNLNVVMGVFLSESGEPRVALASDIAVPPSLRIGSLPGNVTGQYSISGRVWGNATRERAIRSVEYRIDGGDWIEAEVGEATLSVEDGDRLVHPFDAVWNSTEVENGTHDIEVRAIDSNGSSSRAMWSVEISNDDFIPPTLRFLRPASGPVNGTTELSIRASDRNPLVVTMDLGDGVPLPMSGENDTYGLLWDTTLAPEGWTTATVAAFDGAFTVTRSRVFLVDNDATPVFHSVSAPQGPTAGTISVDVEFRDDSPFLTVMLTFGDISFEPSSTSSSEVAGGFLTMAIYDVDSSLLPDGPIHLLSTASDGHLQKAWGNVTLLVDNTAPPATPATTAWDAAWNVSWSPPSADTVSYQVFLSQEPVLDVGGMDPAHMTDRLSWTVPKASVPGYIAVVAIDNVGNIGAIEWTYLGSPPILSLSLLGLEDAVPKGATLMITVTVTNAGEVEARGAVLVIFLGAIEIYNATVGPVPPTDHLNVTLGVPLMHDDDVSAWLRFGTDHPHVMERARVERDVPDIDTGEVATVALLIALIFALAAFMVQVQRF
ncbi:MAG: hypothetical protein L0Z54_03955 [Thermoplasmata archaeon]|nr:hypothetical protein [Thermoplasmata archaeon]